MNRNITPRMTKAAGAREAHGSILDPSTGALYVHMHRESGLAHRHYVLKAWQVRVLQFLLSRVMLAFYFVAVVTWGWMASQAARVPLLNLRIAELTRDAERLDTLTAALTQAQSRYDQVQKMLGTASTMKATDASPGASTAPRPTAPTVRDSARDSTKRDSAKTPVIKRDTTKRDSTRRDSVASDTTPQASRPPER